MAEGTIDNRLLIKRLQAGDEKAYATLVDQYNQRLCIYAFNLVRDHSEAEDIVQNVFVRIWSKREKLNEELSLKSLLYRSVHNEFIDRYRKNQALLSVEQKYYETLKNTAEEESDDELERMIQVMKQEIENLPGKCREVLLLSKKEGLTNDEIAIYLQISKKTVEAHITKAFSILRTRIGEKVNVLLWLLFRNTRNLKSTEI